MPPTSVCLLAWHFGAYFLSTESDLVASSFRVKLSVAYVKLHIAFFLIEAP